MPHTTTVDGVKLYYEEAGSGTPILFVHEHSGDWRSWEPQMRFFSASSLHHLFLPRLSRLRRARPAVKNTRLSSRDSLAFRSQGSAAQRKEARWSPRSATR